jgi:hypothetical protein
MATLTTREAVLGIAPELATVPDPEPPAISTWRQAFLDVERIIKPPVWGDDAEYAQRLWVAHVLTLQNPQLERRQLSSASMGGMQKSYVTAQPAPASQDSWNLTRHGRQLLELLSMLRSGPITL